MSASSTLQRKLSHMFSGMVFPMSALFLPRVVLLSLLGAATFIFSGFELLRLKVPIINRWFWLYFKPLLREKEGSRLTGASYMLISSLIAFLAFPRDVAVLALAFLAIGDAIGTIIGVRIGKRKLLGKTLEGDLACFISCVAIGLILNYGALNIPLLTMLIGSVGATLIEALPLPINDNLTMPLFAGLVMTLTQL